MKEKEYIIKKIDRYNSRGESFNTYFYIVEKTWILGFIPYFRKIEQISFYDYELVRRLYKFDTLEQAQNYIKSILLSNKPRNTTIETVVDVIKK
jgi:hypothetical protein